MDSPVDPELRLTPGLTSTAASRYPPSSRGNDDALLQGRDIELARPTRSVLAPEFLSHSTLEVVAIQQQQQQASPLLSRPYYAHELPVDAHPATALSFSPKTWESSQGDKPREVVYGPPLAELGGTTDGARKYSESVFSSPFDRPSSSATVGKRCAETGKSGGGKGRCRAGKGTGEKGREASCCGWNRRTRSCRVVLAAVIVFVVIAIATGVGVGVGMGLSSRKGETADSTTSSSSSSSSTETRTPTLLLPSPTTTIDPSSSSFSSSAVPLSCPADNLTVYIPIEGSREQGKKRFLLLCDRDFSSRPGADLYQTPTDSLVDCIGLCTLQDGCVGVGWGRAAEDEATDDDDGNDQQQSSSPPSSTCWLKSSLGGGENDKEEEEPSRRPGWSLAVLYEEG